eukprot:TRINITY_DN27349_c0_g5_i1.p1 TRINITY_DN27349_c0_g5~~TRINITY_DN27349_c0_g5_i1.p1  ORF type:complete len:1381 (+),score=350.47 TRINITY_DN27349_c0_g5_i1:88-4230(+)
MEQDPDFVKEIDAKAAQGDEACKGASLCLKAMRSVICQQGCQGNATAYFAASLASLQRQMENKGASSEDTTSSLMLILRRSLPAVSSSAVSSKLADIVAIMERILKSPENEELVRQVLGVLAALANIAYDVGSRPNRKILKPIFTFLGDSRSGVRHRAQLAATAILRRSSAANDAQSLEFASQHLAQMIAAARPDKRSLEELPVQHAIVLLRSAASELPAEGLKNVCVALVGLPAKLGQHPCCTEAFEFLASYLRRDDEEEDEEDAAMSDSARGDHAQLAATLLPALLEVPVSLLNVAYVVAYVRAVAAAVAQLTSEAARSSASPLVCKQKVSAISKLLGLFSERDPTLLKNIREECLRVLQSAGDGGDLEFLEKMPVACQPLLSFERKGAWQHALPVVSATFDALGEVRAARVAPADAPAWTSERFNRARELVQELVSIRDKTRLAEMNVFGKELDQCIGSAIATFGPESVLSVAKLDLLDHSLGDAAFEQKSRSWLLQILRESCKRTNLGFFSGQLLTLASSLKSRSTQAEETSPVLAKGYATLMEQVWALLPSLCDEPLDMSTALLAEGGKLAKQLVAVLVNESSLRDYVWAAFAKLCNNVLEPPSPLSSALLETNKTCLRTLSSRVMPEMFTAIVKMDGENEGKDEGRVNHSRQVALDALQAYAKVAEISLVGNFFKTAVARLLKATTGQDASVPAEQAVPLADIALALVPHLPGEGLEMAMKVFAPMLTGVGGSREESARSGALQKAAYRAVSAVLRHPDMENEQKVDVAKVLDFWPILRDARQTCAVSALKARLVAIESLLSLLDTRLPAHLSKPAVAKTYMECLSGVLPEVLLHLRDPSTGVREAARECLRVSATTAMAAELQTEIVTLVSAGLAGLTSYSKASAVDALSRLLYEHNADMQADLQDRLVKVVLLLLQDNDSQVWRAALKFTKVVVFITPREALEGHLPQILKLFESPHLASAKMLVRKIVERLVKILTPEVLAEAFPEAHTPLLQYIQKQLARKQRPKAVLAGANEDGQEGEDAEQEAADKATSGRRKRGSKTKDDAMDGKKVGKPGRSWDAFQEEDGDAEEEVRPAGGRKRARGAAGATPATTAREPPNSKVAAHEAVQSLLDAWEAESDGEDGGRKRRQGQRSGGKRKHEAVETSTWIHEDSNIPLDFMSADAAHSVLTVRPPQMKRQRGEEVGPAGAQNKVDALRRSGLKFSDDGRLVVEETKEDGDGEEDEDKPKKFNLGTTSAAGTTTGGRPRALSKLAAQRAARALAKAKAKAERRGTHAVRGLENYRPGKKNADGDAKRKGQKLEPFAYVRLNPKVAKEKFKDKATKSFSKVVKGAKQGVLKGLKAKARDSKRLKPNESKTRKKQHRKKVGKPGSR